MSDQQNGRDRFISEVQRVLNSDWAEMAVVYRDNKGTITVNGQSVDMLSSLGMLNFAQHTLVKKMMEESVPAPKKQEYRLLSPGSKGLAS